MFWAGKLLRIAIVVGACSLAGAANGQPVAGNSTSYANPGHGQIQIALQPEPAIPSTVQHDINRIANALEAANLHPNATKEDQRANDNLKAQQDTAKWAGWMLVIAGVETIVTLIGVVLVGLTLAAARRSATAAEETLRETRDNARLELRAYLSAEPAGINQLIRSNEGIGHVDVRNVGKIPARNVSVIIHMRHSMQRKMQLPVLEATETTDRTVQPGAAMRQGSKEQTLVSDLINENFIYVFGTVFYDDGYGNPRFTNFCHRYDAGSYDRSKNWNERPDQTRSIITPEKARYHEQGNDAD